MVGKEQIVIDRKVTLDELNSLITHEKNSRVLKKLYFVKFRYLGEEVLELIKELTAFSLQDAPLSNKKYPYMWEGLLGFPGFYRGWFANGSASYEANSLILVETDCLRRA